MNVPDQLPNSNTSIQIPYPRPAIVFAYVSAIVFVIVGSLGNLLTILALWKCVKLRHATTVFVISLSFADLLFCFINLPLTASRYIHQAWLLGDTLCVLFPFFFYGNVAASLLSMTAITINRYVLINHYTIYSKIYQKRYVTIMITFIWCFSFAILIPTLVRAWGYFGYDPQTFSCTILSLRGRSSKKFLFVFGFLLPCIVIIISYSCIFLKVHRSGQNVSSHVSSNNRNAERQLSQRKDELRITKVMLTVFCSFLICFLPLMIVNVFDSKIKYPTVHILSSVLAWMSSTINPFIYAGMNQQYRQAYLRLLCPRSRYCSSPDLKASTKSGSSVFMDMFNNSGKKKKLCSTEDNKSNSNCHL